MTKLLAIVALWRLIRQHSYRTGVTTDSWLDCSVDAYLSVVALTPEADIDAARRHLLRDGEPLHNPLIQRLNGARPPEVTA